jgi:hypothetical protein
MTQNLTTCGRCLYFPSEGSRAADFYRPWPGSNPRTWGPIASTMTITSRRTTRSELILTKPNTQFCHAGWTTLQPRVLWNRVSLRAVKRLSELSRTSQERGRIRHWKGKIDDSFPFSSHLWFIVIIHNPLLFPRTSRRRVWVCIARNV